MEAQHTTLRLGHRPSRPTTIHHPDTRLAILCRCTIRLRTPQRETRTSTRLFGGNSHMCRPRTTIMDTAAWSLRPLAVTTNRICTITGTTIRQWQVRPLGSLRCVAHSLCRCPATCSMAYTPQFLPTRTRGLINVKLRGRYKKTRRKRTVSRRIAAWQDGMLS